MKRMKKALFTTTLITSALLFTGCGTANEANTHDQNQKMTQGETNNSVLEHKETSTHEKQETTPTTQVTETQPNPVIDLTHSEGKAPSVQNEKVNRLSLFDVKEQKDYQAEFHSGWKASPSSMQHATIEGRGEEALEEGLAVLVIKNSKSNISKIYTIKEEQQTDITPKYVEWIDDNRVYVIIGFPHGTVTKGGKLYELNLTDNSVLPVIDDLKDNEEIVSIKQNEEGVFIYQKHIYDDENVSVGHFEEGTLPVSVTK